ncbi:aldehyde dehydrogenase family protein [Aliiglaciecola sp. CAU 1673]|uniref:aldehyde dehydrogenase family protein n=1 Tax=Aliiglaciecola sp. CAU 1673 TaxID=3032595 RepID=UPI0023DC01AD|nr:aldehyde dehydrogenase family protein [Aliiglaciecola sp. CAU 1673]MDF2179168.1 aldehyde dehydrogenase family protein [Aliiglaciecola sp. CAU 1673]
MQAQPQTAEQTLSAIASTVKHLSTSFASGLTRPLAWRKTQLEQLKRLASEREEEIMAALKADLGKCQLESWTSEVGFLISEIDHAISHLGKWSKPRRVSTPIIAMPGKSYIQPDPKGVVLIIGAWNYPFQLTLAPLIPAIAAGNCALIKPSELAPNTSALIAKLIPKYLDRDAFAVVEGGVPETTEVLKQRFDHILYTGGEAVGKIVMRAAAEHLTPVTLELGGKSPCIVASDCDLEVTASRIAWAKWMNVGQTCIAPDYVLVEKAFADKLIEAIKAKLKDFYGDDPAKSSDYGRIINQRHFDRIAGYLNGVDVTYGGQMDRDARYMAPTIVLNPPKDSALMQEEIFGPILPIVPLETIEQSVAFINARHKPLALYLFTGSSQLEQQVLENTSAGSVCINDAMMFMTNAELPFGGVGNSGMGAYHGQWGFDTFSHLKAVMKRSTWFDINWRYPPFNAHKLKWLKRVG